MTAPLPLRATRRRALVGTLAVLTVTGCDAVAPSPPAESGPGNSSPEQTVDSPADPDEALVAEVRADLTRASVTVTSALGAQPGLRSELAPFGTLHSRHLQALDSDRPRGRRPIRGSAAAVRAEVRNQEARLEAALAAGALSAQSGPLAALLASMSAAVAQQLSVTASR
ncbi:MAG: hypothetical protein ACXWDM_02510 [Nocardioides sp.]